MKAKPVPTTPRATTAAIGPRPGTSLGAPAIAAGIRTSVLDGHHPGRHRDRLHARELVLGQQRPDRVAESRQHHQQPADQLGARSAQVHAQQQRHPGEAGGDADQPQAVRALLVVDPDRQQRREHRRRRHQDPGQARGDLLLPQPDQHERHRHLDRADQQEPAAAAGAARAAPRATRRAAPGSAPPGRSARRRSSRASGRAARS